MAVNRIQYRRIQARIGSTQIVDWEGVSRNMDYKLERIREFAKLNLIPPTDLASFIAEIGATMSGEIVVSDDRIRFAATNKVFRFADADSAGVMADRLESYYDDLPEKPTIRRS